MFVGSNSRRGEIQPVRIRAAPDSDQQMRPFNVARTGRVAHANRDLLSRLADLFRTSVQPYVNTVFAQNLGDFFGDVGIFAPQQLRTRLHDRDPRTQPPEQLPKLQPYIPATQRDQVLRHAIQLHDGRAVEIRHIFEPVDRRPGWPATGIDKYLIGRQCPLAAAFQFYHYRFRRGEAGFAENQIEIFGLLQPRLAASTKTVDDLALPLAHFDHVHGNLAGVHAVVRAAFGEIGHAPARH